MNTDAVMQSHVDRGARLVDVPPTRSNETHGKRPHSSFVKPGRRPQVGHPSEPSASVDPEGVGSIDEDVGNLRITRKCRQWPELGEIRGGAVSISSVCHWPRARWR